MVIAMAANGRRIISTGFISCNMKLTEYFKMKFMKESFGMVLKEAGQPHYFIRRRS